MNRQWIKKNALQMSLNQQSGGVWSGDLYTDCETSFQNRGMLKDGTVTVRPNATFCILKIPKGATKITVYSSGVFNPGGSISYYNGFSSENNISLSTVWDNTNYSDWNTKTKTRIIPTDSKYFAITINNRNTATFEFSGGVLN